jgi:transcriptional regulator with XRE-family HTH domain
MAGFNDRLKFVMQKRHQSQLALSRILDVTQPLIHYWLKGSDLPRKYHAQKLAWALRVDYAWLITGDGKPFAFQLYPLEKFWVDFAERLAYLLWTRNMNVMNLRTVIDKNTVNMWLDKQRSPTENDLSNLSEFFSCPRNWLMSGDTNLLFESQQDEYKKWKAENYVLLFGDESLESTKTEKRRPILGTKRFPVIEQGQRTDFALLEGKIKKHFPAAFAVIPGGEPESFFDRALEALRSHSIVVSFYQSALSRKFPYTFTAKVFIDSPEKVKQLGRRTPLKSYPYRSSLHSAMETGLYKGFDILNALLKSKEMPWLLNSLSSYFKFRLLRNGKLGRVIFQISQLNDTIRSRNKQMDFFSNKADTVHLADVKKFDGIRRAFHNQFGEINLPDELLNELSEFEPVHAYLLKKMFDEYNTMIQVEDAMLAANAEVGDDREYFKFYLLATESLSAIQADIQHIMDRLCWKFSPFTFFKMKYRIVHHPIGEAPLTKTIEEHLKTLAVGKKELTKAEVESFLNILKRSLISEKNMKS